MPSSFASKLASLAEAEYTKFHVYKETDPDLAKRIKQYWVGIGLPFPGVSTAWSAVFVSFFVQSAGASAAEFSFSARHSEFVHQAAQNAANGVGVFRAWPVASYAPKIGDIIHNNRDGNSYDYAYAAANNAYYSHSAIVVEEGVDGNGRYVRTVGGNEGNSVGDRVVRVNASGLIKQPPTDPKYYISVIETLK